MQQTKFFVVSSLVFATIAVKIATSLRKRWWIKKKKKGNTEKEGIGGLNATDVRWQRIPLLWSTVREKALSKGFSFNMRDAKFPYVCRRTKLPGRGVHSEKVNDIGRG